MRILFISDYFPPFTPGGAEWSSFYSAQALAKRGQVVTVLTPNYGRLPFRQKVKGFWVIRPPFPYKLGKGQKTLPFWVNNNLFYYLYFAFWIIKSFFQERPDLVHLQSRFALPGVVLAKFFLRFKLVFTIRDTALFCPTGVCLQAGKIKKEYAQFSHFWQKCSQDYLRQYLEPESFWKRGYYRLTLFYFWFNTLVKRWCLKFCDQTVFISQALQGLYLKAGLVKRQKSKIIYNLPPFSKYQQARIKPAILKKKYKLNNKKVVLFVGRKTKGKGVEVLLKSAKEVYKKDKQAVFLFVGKGAVREKKDYLRDIASVKHEELFGFYQQADLVVVPTLGFEPLGRVPIEAALFKRAVVVANSGGLPEQVINGKTGFIVPKGNFKRLSQVILRLLSNSKLREKIGQNQQEYIQKKFAEEKIFQQTISLYRSLE